MGLVAMGWVVLWWKPCWPEIENVGMMEMVNMGPRWAVFLGLLCPFSIHLGNSCLATEVPFTPSTLRGIITCIGDAGLPRLLTGSHWTKPLSQQDQGL